MSTTLISIHGRGHKPGKQALETLWHDALTHGIARFQDDKLETFTQTPHELVYFGDLTTPYLVERGEAYDESLDLEDRRHALAGLKLHKRREFYSRGVYERLPGKSAIGELLADVGLPIMRRVGLAHTLFDKFAPDVLWYLLDNDGFRAAAVERLMSALREPMARGDNIVLTSHCLGSIVAYDTLWTLSHGQAPDWYDRQKVRLWLTLGSPLGDETVKGSLLGSEQPDPTRHPYNVVRWLNVTAEDDYISHDNTVANDFRAMIRKRLISSIVDDKILNLTMRYGKSNPHSSVGYLTHPRVIKAIADVLPIPK